MEEKDHREEVGGVGGPFGCAACTFSVPVPGVALEAVVLQNGKNILPALVFPPDGEDTESKGKMWAYTCSTMEGTLLVWGCRKSDGMRTSRNSSIYG